MLPMFLGQHSSYHTIWSVGLNAGFKIFAIVLQNGSQGKHRLKLHKGVLTSLGLDEPNSCLCQVVQGFYNDSKVSNKVLVEVAEP